MLRPQLTLKYTSQLWLSAGLKVSWLQFQKQAYDLDLPARTLSYLPGFNSRYRLHKKAKFCSFMTFSQIAPFFMSHYGNFWTKKNKISARNCEIFWQIRLPKMSLLRLMTLGLPTPANSLKITLSFHDYETLIYFLNQGQRIVLIV